MAIDPNPSPPSPAPTAAVAIDNEFPSYRAISPGAVLSLVLGLGSVFCFTSLWFLLVVAASIAIGLLAIRKIRRLPEVLTGANFARVGIAVSLFFGLSAATHALTSDLLVKLDAGKFARQYIEILKAQPTNVALFYEQPADYRKNKKPDEVAEEFKKNKNPATANMYDEKVALIARIKERLKGQGEQVRYGGIESLAVDGLTLYANALIEFDGPGGKENPEKEQFALVELVKVSSAGPNDWMVKEVHFPYTPASKVATVQKGHDDGHGHSH